MPSVALPAGFDPGLPPGTAPGVRAEIQPVPVPGAQPPGGYYPTAPAEFEYDEAAEREAVNRAAAAAGQ
jgi:hypothetical protein